jgi:hypothetical protein
VGQRPNTPFTQFMAAAKARRLCVDRLAAHPIYDWDVRQAQIAEMKRVARELGQPEPDIADEPARSMMYFARTPGGEYTHAIAEAAAIHVEYAEGAEGIDFDAYAIAPTPDLGEAVRQLRAR